MSGLDKMVEQIKAEAIEKARQMEQEAEKEAERFLAEEKQKAEQAAAQQVEQAKLEAQRVLETGRSGAVLERKRQVLAAKQQMISHVLEKARKELEQLPEEEYFAMLCQQAARSARSGEDGQICLNQRDLDRLPRDFEKKLNGALQSGKLVVSKEPREIDGGFVLVYGGVEENGSLSALFAAAQEELRDTAREILFTP